MKSNFADFLDSMYIPDIMIATEADDITGQVADDVKNTIGETPSTQSDTDNRSDEEDLEKTDDIFDLKKDNDNPSSDNPNNDNLDSVDDDSSNDSDSDISNNSTDDSDSDENSDSFDDNSENLEDSSTDNADSSNDDLVFTKKNKIRDNLVQLYTIVSGNIEAIESSIININEEQTIEVLNMVITNLRNCKKYIYDTLTKELKNLEYDELLRRYITLKKVYDLSIETMDTHFKKVNSEKKK